MGWLASLLSLLKRFFDWREAEGHRAEGRNTERRQTAAVIEEKADVADQVRADVASDLGAHPDRVRDDDGFKRPG